MSRSTDIVKAGGEIQQTRQGDSLSGRGELSLDGSQSRVGALLPDFIGMRTFSRDISGSAGPLSAGLEGEVSVDIDLDARVALQGGDALADTPWRVAYTFPDAERLSANPYFRLVGDASYDPDEAARVFVDVPDFRLDFEIGASFDASLRLFGEIDAGVDKARLDETIRLSDLLSGTPSVRLPIFGVATEDRHFSGAQALGLDLAGLVDVETTDANEILDKLSERIGAPPGLFELPTPQKLVGDLENWADLLQGPFPLDSLGADLLLADETGARKPILRLTADEFLTASLPTQGKGDAAASLRAFFPGGLGWPGAVEGLDDISELIADGGQAFRDWFDALMEGQLDPPALAEPWRADLEHLIEIEADGIAPPGDDPETGAREAEETRLAELRIDADALATAKLGADANPFYIDQSKDAGPFSVGIRAQTADVDLVSDVSLAREASAAARPLETRLAFFDRDPTEGDATPVEMLARIPRLTVHFVENATFWNEDVARALRDVAANDERAQEDLALFVDFENRAIPGAFTGKTGSIAGGVARSIDGGETWTLLTTSPEGSAPLLASEIAFGADPRIETLRPAPGERYRYVVLDDFMRPEKPAPGDAPVFGAVINMEDARAYVDLDFSDLVGFDGVLEARLEAVEGRIHRTGWIEGAPSIDFRFPSAERDEVWVRVENRAGADVWQEIRLVGGVGIELGLLKIDSLGFEASLGPVSARLGLDTDWLFKTRFDLEAEDFGALYSGVTPVVTEDEWAFAISRTASGAAGVKVDPGSYAKIEDDGSGLVNLTGFDGLFRDYAGLDQAARDDLQDDGEPLFYEPGLRADLDSNVNRLRYTLRDNAGDKEGDTFNRVMPGFTDIIGSPRDDWLRGDGAASMLDGGEGSDTVIGGAGGDDLFGGPGDDALFASQTDTAWDDGPARDSLYGGSGEDRLVASSGPGLYDGGEDVEVGSSGGTPLDLDVVDYRLAPEALTVNLQTGWFGGPAAQHEFRNIEGFAGTAFGDSLTGDSGRNYFEGGAGNDDLRGEHVPAGLSRAERLALDGDLDRLYGQEGNDTLRGGPGPDMLDGGPGVDWADYADAPVSVYADLADTPIEGNWGVQEEMLRPLLVNDVTPDDLDRYARIDGQAWRGWAQGDKFRDVENLRGTDFDDILLGDERANVIEGGAGDDRLAARFGESTDPLYTPGEDRLSGGPGDDVLLSAAEAHIRALDDDGRSEVWTIERGPDVLPHVHADGGEGFDLYFDESTLRFVTEQTLLIRATTFQFYTAADIGFSEDWESQPVIEKVERSEAISFEIHGSVEVPPSLRLGAEGEVVITREALEEAELRIEQIHVEGKNAPLVIDAEQAAPRFLSPFDWGARETVDGVDYNVFASAVSLPDGPINASRSQSEDKGGIKRKVKVGDEEKEYPGFIEDGRFFADLDYKREIVNGNDHAVLREDRWGLDRDEWVLAESSELRAALLDHVGATAVIDGMVEDAKNDKAAVQQVLPELPSLFPPFDVIRESESSTRNITPRLVTLESLDFFITPLADHLSAPDWPDEVRIASLAGVEGAAGASGEERFEGSGGSDHLLGGGGPDLIAAREGADVVSFGPAQPGVELFSFPGRGFLGVDSVNAFADLEVTSGGGGVPGSGGSTPQDKDTGGSGGPPQPPEPAGPVEETIQDYLNGSRDLAGLEVLRADLVAREPDFGGYAIVDAGAGADDTLDLRYDRGLDFLPSPGPFGAQVDLLARATRAGAADASRDTEAGGPGEAGWTPLPALFDAASAATVEDGVGEATLVLRDVYDDGEDAAADAALLARSGAPALLLGVEHVIGTGRNDVIVGDDRNNIIEGGAGVAIRKIDPVADAMRTYSDWLDGRGGFDALSYANAPAPITLMLELGDVGGAGETARAAAGAEGDAVGDAFRRFEAVIGSAFGDELGARVYPGGGGRPNRIQKIDGGPGDDRIAVGVAREGDKGQIYEGGEGDDLFEVGAPSDFSVFATFSAGLGGSVFADASSEGGKVATLSGGPGVDIVRFADGWSVTQEGAGFVAQAPGLTVRMDGIEWIDDGVMRPADTTLPGFAGPQRLHLAEGAGAERHPFVEIARTMRPEERLVVTDLQDPGALWTAEGALVREGDEFTAEAAAALLMLPAGDAEAARVGYSVTGFGPDEPGIVEMRDRLGEGAPLGLAETAPPVRREPITIELGEATLLASQEGTALIFGESLSLGADALDLVREERDLVVLRTELEEVEDDIAVAAQRLEEVESQLDDGGETVRYLENTEPEFTEAVRVDYSSMTLQVDMSWSLGPYEAALRRLDIDGAARDAVLLGRYVGPERGFWDFSLSFDFETNRPSTVLEDALGTLRDERDDLIAEIEVLDAQRANLAADFDALAGDKLAVAERVVERLDLEERLPESSLGDAQPYRIAAIDGGRLRLDPDEGESGDGRTLAAGDVVLREDLDDLVFESSFGLIGRTAMVAFESLDLREVVIEAVPDWAEMTPDAFPSGYDTTMLPLGFGFRIAAAPEAGAPYLRGETALRAPLTPGVVLSREDVAGLGLAAKEALPGRDDREIRSGVTLDFEADPVSEALAMTVGDVFSGPRGLLRPEAASRPLEWFEWTEAEGGSGQRYAWIGNDVFNASSSAELAEYARFFEAWGGPALASLSSPGEAAFIAGQLPDDAFAPGGFGPLLGAARDGDIWMWGDGAPLGDNAAWGDGQAPGGFSDAPGQRALRLDRTIDDAPRLVALDIVQVDGFFGTGGFLLELAPATPRDDRIAGGAGVDSLDGLPGDDLLFGRGGPDTLSGGPGNDRLDGGDGDDLLRGGPGNDALAGGSSADALEGGAGADRLEGGAGPDVLQGGAGDDTLDGGAGDDVLTGGPGGDLFVLGAGEDRATDFTPGEDQLDLGGAAFDAVETSEGLRINSADGALLLSGWQGEYAEIASSLASPGTPTEPPAGPAPLPETLGEVLSASGAPLAPGAEDIALEWTRWSIEDGGSGQAYAWIGNDAFDVGSSAELAGFEAFFAGAARLAALGDPGEAAFVASILPGDAFAGGVFGPILGADRSGQEWFWSDGAAIAPQAPWGDGQAPGGSRDAPNQRALRLDRDSDGAPHLVALQLEAVDDMLGTGGFLLEVSASTSGPDTLTGSAGDDNLAGGAGDDAIAAGDGDDLLTGGPGADSLTGGGGNDRFLLRRGDGVDTLLDFGQAEAGVGRDVIDLSALGLAARNTIVVESAASDRGGARVAFGPDAFVVAGVAATALGQDAIRFAEPGPADIRLVTVEPDRDVPTEIDGLRVDMEAVGARQLAPPMLGELIADHVEPGQASADAGWVAWPQTVGGSGRVFAWIPAEALSTEATPDSVTAALDGGETQASLASIGGPGEAAFAQSLLDSQIGPDREIGPLLGARLDGENWAWRDGTDFDFAPWSGDPLAGAAVRLDRDVQSGEPLFRAVAPEAGNGGYLLEAAAAASMRADFVEGSGGDDIIALWGGDDVAFGGAGDDVIDGGAGRDRLSGGPGADRLIGGPGPDRFLLTPASGQDVIADFEPGIDRLDLTALDLGPIGRLDIIDLSEGALLAAGGASVILEGVAADTLGDRNFIGAPRLTFDGVEIEMETVFDDHTETPRLAGARFGAIFDRTVSGSDRWMNEERRALPIDWRRWSEDAGGDGRFYAFLDTDRYIKGKADLDDFALYFDRDGAQDLASISDPAELAFVASISTFDGDKGPFLGATRALPPLDDGFRVDGPIQLTGPDDKNAVGSWWSDAEVSLDEPFTLRAKLFFGGRPGGGDGIAIVLRNGEADQGKDGSGLGYKGLDRSFAVEFDTFSNEGEISEDHATFLKGGNMTPLEEEIPLGELEDSRDHDVVLRWFPEDEKMILFVDGVERGSYNYDVRDDNHIDANTARIGFTASTGGAANQHRVTDIRVERIGGDYAWNDGTPFDYAPWSEEEGPGRAFDRGDDNSIRLGLDEDGAPVFVGVTDRRDRANGLVVEADAVATTRDDRILGTARGDIINTDDGDDVIDGGAGADSIDGGAGDDVIAGGPGDDHLDGGPGDDLFVLSRGGGADTIGDFEPGDRLDIGDLQLRALSDIRARRDGDDLTLIASDVTVTLTDWGAERPAPGLDAFLRAPVWVEADRQAPEPLSVGDRIPADLAPGLRLRRTDGQEEPSEAQAALRLATQWADPPPVGGLAAAAALMNAPASDAAEIDGTGVAIDPAPDWTLSLSFTDDGATLGGEATMSRGPFRDSISVSEGDLIPEALGLSGASLVSVNGVALPEAGAMLPLEPANLLIPASGALAFSPSDGLRALGQGEEATLGFAYAVDRPHGGTLEAAATIRVVGDDDAPDTVEDTVAVSVDAAIVAASDLLANDSDPEGAALALARVDAASAAGAAIALGADGEISLDYAALGLDVGEIIVDTFQYVATDGTTESAPTIVELIVTNAAPTAVPDTATTQEDTPVVIDVLANDLAADPASLSVTSTTAPANGTVTLLGNGELRYTPDRDFFGTDAFAYLVTGSAGQTDNATVSVEVTPVDDLPEVTSPAAFDVDENTTAVGTVAGTDVDTPAGDLVFSIEGGADAAAFQIDAASGALSFQTAPDHEAPQDQGADNVYDVIVGLSDASGTATQEIAVTVTDVFEKETEVPGTDDKDVLTGTDGEDEIETGGGLFDVVTGGADLDVFIFTNAANGERENATVTDYTPGEDAIDLLGTVVDGHFSWAGTTYLFMNGADYDTLVVAGANTIDDITFV